MQTDYLRYFIDVATLGSMTAAAKKNFMTPQGVSRSISALESDLGCKLLERHSNKVTLTSIGERLLQDALQIVERENGLLRTVDDFHSENLRKKRTRFVCYSSPIFYDTSLFFPANGLGTAHYGRVQYLQRNTENAVEALVAQSRSPQLDEVVVAGLSFYDLFAEEGASMIGRLIDAGYEYRPFMRTCEYVLVPAYSPLAEMGDLGNDDIRSYPLAVSSDGMAERAIRQHIGADSVFVSTSDGSYRSRLCRMGEALAFVPGLALVFGVPEGTAAVPMRDSYSIEVGFAARASAFEDGLLADIIERLRSFYGKNPIEGAFALTDGSLEASLFASALNR